MCLLVFAFQESTEYPLIFAGNRDEFHGRPTSPARFWDDHPAILAGRDLQAGGSWLGVTTSGRFATVTNFREPDVRGPGERSRGELVIDYLTGDLPPDGYLSKLAPVAQQYSGFNLLLGGPDSFSYFTNRGGVPSMLDAGMYGLSNDQLNTPWPKVQRARRLFEEVIARPTFSAEDLLDVLADRYLPSDEELPNTGVGVEWERILSPIFISGPEYGTRASTVVLVHASGEITFVEKSFGPNGEETGVRHFKFEMEHA